MAIIDIPKYRELTQEEQALYEAETGKRYKYILLENFTYHSKRYGKRSVCEEGMLSDGATGAMDIVSKGWWVHDDLCNEGKWQDGTKITNWIASQVLQDILAEEGRKWRSKYWFWFTFAFGGGKARDNGMFQFKA